MGRRQLEIITAESWRKMRCLGKLIEVPCRNGSMNVITAESCVKMRCARRLKGAGLGPSRELVEVAMMDKLLVVPWSEGSMILKHSREL